MLNLGLIGIMFCKTEKAEKVSRHFISFLTETKLFSRDLQSKNPKT